MHIRKTVEDTGEPRVVMHIPDMLAPVKLAVFPLVKKDGLPEKAREIIDKLKFDYNCQYEEKILLAADIADRMLLEPRSV
jgi:glycyl-tRNA synthetase